MHSGIETGEEFPPARKRSWGMVAFTAAFLLFGVALPIGQSFRFEDPLGSISWTLTALVAALLLGVAGLELYSRSRRRLQHFLATRYPGDFMVIARSSSDFADCIEALTGKDLTSDGPRSWVLGVVVRGDAAEVWHFDQRTPRLLVRIPWASVTTVSAGAVNTTEGRDRAVILTVCVDGRHLRLPVVPQRNDDLLRRPATDEEFAGILTHLREAHAHST